MAPKHSRRRDLQVVTLVIGLVQTLSCSEPGDPLFPPAAPSEAGSVALLTDSQHANAIRDLLGEIDVPAVHTPGVIDLFSREAALFPVGGALLHQYQLAAEEAARQAVTRLDEVVDCDVAALGEDVCADAFIDRFASRAFRRPLEPEERAGLTRLYEVGRADGFAAGVELVIQAVLLSPGFLYRTRIGTLADDDLTPFELAAELSFFLLDSIPDDVLWSRANDGSIIRPEVLREEVDRLLTLPRVQRNIDDAFATWLGVRTVLSVTKVDALFPSFKAKLRQSMARESEMFIHDVLWERDGSLRELLTSPLTFIDDSLAAHYGVDGTYSSEHVLTELDPSQRGGILTHASLLSTLASPSDSSIVHRGLFVNRRFLCIEFPPPPSDAVAAVSDVTDPLTDREFADYRASNGLCATCHSLIDPPGIAFEHYDATGAWRTEADGSPVFATTAVDLAGPEPVAVAGTIELATLLAESPDVAWCIAQQFFERALERKLTAADFASLEPVNLRFAGADGDLIELFRAIPETEAFRAASREVP